MAMMRRFFACWLLLACLAITAGAADAAAQDEWAWISSDDKYNKLYSPKRVQVINKVILSNGTSVPTKIQAWTKTGYTYAGAQETISNYGIQEALPDPMQLSYSLALVEINPQNRTIEYVQEDFYDKNGKVIWSKVYDPRTVKEINSLEFDEDFYTAIVDSVFRHGETNRRTAGDRWYTLWKADSPDGASTSAIADTTTMRLKGDNLIFWEWVEMRNAQKKVQEVKFMKMMVNLPQGTQRVAAYRYWSASRPSWQDLSGELDGTYTAIRSGTYEEKGLKRLRAYAKGYQFWLNRYSLEDENEEDGE